HRLLSQEIASWAAIRPDARILVFYHEYLESEDPAPAGALRRHLSARRLPCVSRRAADDAERAGVDRRKGRDAPPDSHGVGARRSDENRQRPAESRRPRVARSD